MHGGVSHEDEQFLDVLFDSPAQLGLNRRRILQARTALGQQLPLEAPLGQSPLAAIRMGEGFGLPVDVLHCRRPPEQGPVPGVERLQVVDVRSRWTQHRCLGPS